MSPHSLKCLILCTLWWAIQSLCNFMLRMIILSQFADCFVLLHLQEGEPMLIFASEKNFFLVPSNVSDLLWIKYVFHKFANYCIRFLIVGSLPYNLKYLDGDLSPYTVIKIELNWICILHSIPFGIVICVQLKVLHALHFLPFISFSMQNEYCYSHTVRCKSLEPNNSITKVKNNT